MNKQTIKNKQAHKQTNKQTKLTNNTPIFIKSINFIKLFLMQFTLFLFTDEDCHVCPFNGGRVDAC
jgi:hypothetical protein